MSHLVRRHRWWLIGAAWVAVCLLGFWGMAVANGRNGAPASIADRVYLLQQLFGTSFNTQLARQNWQLDAARFLGVIVAGLTFLQGLVSLFGERFAIARLRTASGHVVVCGLGDKGLRLATDFKARGHKVVAIELDPANAAVASAKDKGVIVVSGDATDIDLLRRVGVPRAAELVALCDDATDAEITAAVRSLTAGRTDPLRCSVHLVDNQLCALLRAQSLRDGGTGVRLEFFNVFQRGAQAWLAAHAPEPHEGEPDRPLQVAVLGLDALGQELVLATAQRAAIDAGVGGPPVRLILVDPAATQRFRSLALKHPLLEPSVSVTTIDLDLDMPAADGAKAFRTFLDEEAPDAAWVTFPSDSEALSAGLLVHHSLAHRGTQVVVRTRSESGLATLLATEPGQGGVGIGVTGFPLLDRTCTVELIEGGTNEQLARAIHADYMGRVQRGELAGGEFAVAWDELPPSARESNRLAADQLAGGLAAVHYDVVPIQHWDGAERALAPAEVDAIAEREHDRWRAERAAAGWTYGATRDDAAKHNPLLVPWDELGDADKEFNREAAANLPRLLARAGFEIVPTTR